MSEQELTAAELDDEAELIKFVQQICVDRCKCGAEAVAQKLEPPKDPSKNQLSPAAVAQFVERMNAVIAKTGPLCRRCFAAAAAKDEADHAEWWQEQRLRAIAIPVRGGLCSVCFETGPAVRIVENGVARLLCCADLGRHYRDIFTKSAVSNLLEDDGPSARTRCISEALAGARSFTACLWALGWSQDSKARESAFQRLRAFASAAVVVIK